VAVDSLLHIADEMRTARASLAAFLPRAQLDNYYSRTVEATQVLPIMQLTTTTAGPYTRHASQLKSSELSRSCVHAQNQLQDTAVGACGPWVMLWLPEVLCTAASTDCVLASLRLCCPLVYSLPAANV
jgi:hypothetical protein